MKRKPDFLVAGVQKSGTTWLARKISDHPKVMVPVNKEIHFFNKRHNYEKGLNWYLNFFEDIGSEHISGEFTPNYFWTTNNKYDALESDRNREIPKLIYENIPNTKLIISLRNPVDRAISAYYHHIFMRRISPKTRILDAMKHYGILSMGFYDDHLIEYLKYFSKDQILIILFEQDILAAPKQTMNKIYNFLNINQYYTPKNLESSVNTKNGSLFLRINYYSKFCGNVLRYLFPVAIKKDLCPIVVTSRERHTLHEIYKLHNLRLQSLLDRDILWINS